MQLQWDSEVWHLLDCVEWSESGGEGQREQKESVGVVHETDQSVKSVQQENKM